MTYTITIRRILFLIFFRVYSIDERQTARFLTLFQFLTRSHVYIPMKYHRSGQVLYRCQKPRQQISIIKTMELQLYVRD